MLHRRCKAVCWLDSLSSLPCTTFGAALHSCASSSHRRGNRDPHLGQLQDVLADALDQLHPLLGVGEVQAALHHAAAVAVRRDIHAVLAARVVDELCVLRPQPLQPRAQLQTRMQR